MQKFNFGVRFRFDTIEIYETSFEMALSDEEIIFVKSFIKENTADMPFWAFEYENEPLFKRFLRSHVSAIISYVNKNLVKPGEDPFTEETICWDYVHAEFDWPEQLLDS